MSEKKKFPIHLSKLAMFLTSDDKKESSERLGRTKQYVQKILNRESVDTENKVFYDLKDLILERSRENSEIHSQNYYKAKAESEIELEKATM